LNLTLHTATDIQPIQADLAINLTSEDNMSAAIARIFPRISAASVANIDSFVSVTLFCGLGLLLSLSVLILDQYIPGEWF
jgi:hypothetical protein